MWDATLPDGADPIVVVDRGAVTLVAPSPIRGESRRRDRAAAAPGPLRRVAAPAIRGPPHHLRRRDRDPRGAPAGAQRATLVSDREGRPPS